MVDGFFAVRGSFQAVETAGTRTQRWENPWHIELLRTPDTPVSNEGRMGKGATPICCQVSLPTSPLLCPLAMVLSQMGPCRVTSFVKPFSHLNSHCTLFFLLIRMESCLHNSVLQQVLSFCQKKCLVYLVIPSLQQCSTRQVQNKC